MSPEAAWDGVRPRARLVAAPVVEAQALAREILARAEAEARSVIEDAELQREVVREEARSTGRFEGLVEAQELLVVLQRRRSELLESAEVRRFAIALGLAIAERIPSAWGADAEAWGGASLRLRGTPGTQPPAQGRARSRPECAVLAAMPATAKLDLHVEEDPTVHEPGCIAESECGRVDGSLHPARRHVRAAPELPG